MEELTEKQIKNRWIEIKRQISARQLLAYRVGIPLDKWDHYMYSLPEASEINRIYKAIQEDRTVKTLRIKEGLSKIVGYRESQEFAKKSGVSGTSIKEILDEKKIMAGYDIINRLELFLHIVLTDFELSIENPLTIKNYSQDYLGDIASEISRVAENLQHYCYKLTQMARNQETETDWQGNKTSPAKSVEYSINTLTEIKDKIDLFWSVYIEKKI